MPESVIPASPVVEVPVPPPPTPANGEAAPVASGEVATDAAAAPVEAAKPVPAPVADAKSRAFAEEARREADYRKKELALKREREELAREREAAKAERDMAALAKNDPLAYLKSMGYTPDQIAKKLVDADKPPDALELAQKAREELEAYKRQQAEYERKRQDAAVAARLRQFEAEVVDTVSADADRWEYINANEAQALVAERVKQHYNEFGKVLDVEKAADALEAEFEARAERLAKTKKWTAKHAPKPVAPAAAGDQKPGAKSLSNSVVPAPGAKVSSDKPLTDEERIERAVRRLKEQNEKKD